MLDIGVLVQNRGISTKIQSPLLFFTEWTGYLATSTHMMTLYGLISSSVHDYTSTVSQPICMQMPVNHCSNLKQWGQKHWVFIFHLILISFKFTP